MFKNNLKSTFPILELSICTSNYQHQLNFSMSNSSKTGRISRTPHRSTSKAGDTRQAPTFLADGRLFLGDMLCVANSVQQNHQKKHKHLLKKLKKHTNFKFGNIPTPNLGLLLSFQLKLHFCFSSKLQLPEGANKATCGTCMRLLALVHGKDLKHIEIWGDGKKMDEKMDDFRKVLKTIVTEKTVFCIARLFFVTSLDPTRDAQRSWEAHCMAVFLRKTPSETWQRKRQFIYDSTRWWMDLYSFLQSADITGPASAFFTSFSIS